MAKDRKVPRRKVVAVSCSHGCYADPTALEAVLQFCKDFRPDIRIHLGDFTDMSAFMGSKVRDGEGDPVQPDIDGGLDFLAKFRPTHLLLGNHEDRLHRLASSHNEMIRFCATSALQQIEEWCRRHGCALLPYTGNEQSLVLGNARFMHGTFFNEMSIRDAAEAYAPPGGVVVFGHTHRPGLATGRRHDAPVGINVGTLTRRASMDYAKTRRATLGWGQAFAWGWVGESDSQLYLCNRQDPYKPWLLPPI